MLRPSQKVNGSSVTSCSWICSIGLADAGDATPRVPTKIKQAADRPATSARLERDTWGLPTSGRTGSWLPGVGAANSGAAFRYMARWNYSIHGDPAATDQSHRAVVVCRDSRRMNSQRPSGLPCLGASTQGSPPPRRDGKSGRLVWRRNCRGLLRSSVRGEPTSGGPRRDPVQRRGCPRYPRSPASSTSPVGRRGPWRAARGLRACPPPWGPV